MAKFFIGFFLTLCFFLAGFATLGAILLNMPLWMGFGIFCMGATVYALHSVISL